MKNPAAQELGRLGGKKTLEKYGKEQMKEWGKKGGRPKKTTIPNPLLNSEK